MRHYIGIHFSLGNFLQLPVAPLGQEENANFPNGTQTAQVLAFPTEQYIHFLIFYLYKMFYVFIDI